MKINFLLLIALCAFGCEKTSQISPATVLKSNQVNNTSTGGNNRQLTTANGVYQLVLQPDGTYLCGYENQGYSVTLKVSNIVYQVYDQDGNLIGPRNGDPVMGNISVVSPGSASADIQPDQNGHFSINDILGVITSTTVDYNSWYAAENTYITNLVLWTGSWFANWPIGPPVPPPVPIYIFDYFKTTTVGSGNAGSVILTGKIMRDSIGTTLALAREDYPLPAPPPPALPLPYTVNQTSPSLSSTSTVSNGIKTVTVTDNKTLKNYIPTFTFQLNGSLYNQLVKTNGKYNITSTYNPILWTQGTTIDPHIVTNTSNHTISFGIAGHFTASNQSHTLLPIYITYNYVTGATSIIYNSSDYLTYWETTVM